MFSSNWKRNTFVVANPERFENLCDFFKNLFFWINLAYKYAEVCICFANHESLIEVWTGSSAFCFVVIWWCRSCVMEWSDKAVFCLLFIFFDKTSSAVTNISWYFLSSLISKRKSLSIAAVNLLDNFSFHLVVNDTLKQHTITLEGVPATICFMQTGMLWWNGEAVVLFPVFPFFFLFFFFEKIWS